MFARAAFALAGLVTACGGQVVEGWGYGNTGTGGSEAVAVPCGNGVIDQVEECDDGNALSDDGCSAECTVEPGYYCPTPGTPCRSLSCGNGVVEPEFGEECDDGIDAADYGGACGSDCLVTPRCGDRVTDREFGEECDDGLNAAAYGGACAESCRLSPWCGDAVLQREFGEVCDDGSNNGDYGLCAPGCTLGRYCGDGLVEPDYEECDDGNEDNGDGCNSVCQRQWNLP